MACAWCSNVEAQEVALHGGGVPGLRAEVARGGSNAPLAVEHTRARANVEKRERRRAVWAEQREVYTSLAHAHTVHVPCVYLGGAARGRNIHMHVHMHVHMHMHHVHVHVM